MIMIDVETRTKIKPRIPRWLAILLVVSNVLALWAGSFYVVCEALAYRIPFENLPDMGGLATLFFGVSGLALILFSLLVGGAAIFGYQSLKEDVRKEVEAASRQRIDTLEKELRGRVVAAVGMVLGMFYLHSERPNQDEQEKEQRRDYLAEAVEICWRAYKILKDVEGNGKYMALNNYVFFSCVQGQAGTGVTREFLMEKARDLRKVGQEKQYWEALLTYCRAILEFGDTVGVLSDAQELATELSNNRELTYRQKKEATSYMASLGKRLAQRSAVPPTLG